MATEEYYGTDSLHSTIVCNNMCPSCRGETSKPVKRSFLIDHIEASIFDSGPVSVSKLCSKIRKGSIWVAKLMEITKHHCHELVMLMRVHHIITLHWSNVSAKRGDDNYTKKDIVCSFEKKAADFNIRMNYRDDS